MGRVIAISNLKGGIGKTTTVVNIGAGLAHKGARVLLVDVDAQGNLALGLGIKPRRTIYEVLVDGAKAADCLTPARPNLDLLAGDETLLTAQPVIARRADWSRALDQAILPLKSKYDFILIDSAGSLTPLNVNALVSASDVIAPTTVEHFSINSLDLLFTQIARIKGSSASIRMILPTLYDPRSRQSVELLDGLREQYGTLVASPVRVNVKLSEASRLGKTIFEFDPRSRGAVDYAQLVEQICSTFRFVPTPISATAEAQPAYTNGNSTPPKSDTPAAQPTIGHGPATCPYCARPLQFANLAGYRVGYCDHCHYKTQSLQSRLR
jgi:chromosome partitioning protein